MKKTLALVLALLVAFSMFSVATFAAADTVTLVFKKDDIVIKKGEIAPGADLLPEYLPDVPKEYFTEVKDPENGQVAKTKHTFKGWRLVLDGVDKGLFYPGTMPAFAEADAGKTAIFTAEYASEDYSERQSFWNLIESIFERINKIFEYFATIFNF